MTIRAEDIEFNRVDIEVKVSVGDHFVTDVLTLHGEQAKEVLAEVGRSTAAKPAAAAIGDAITDHWIPACIRAIVGSKNAPLPALNKDYPGQWLEASEPAAAIRASLRHVEEPPFFGHDLAYTQPPESGDDFGENDTPANAGPEGIEGEPATDEGDDA